MILPPPDFETPDGSIRLYQGEALDLLTRFPSELIDMTLTDPPYSSGGMYRADRNQSVAVKYCHDDDARGRPLFSGDNRDAHSFALWCALWLDQCQRISRPGAYVHVFTDWRQLPTVSDVLQAGGFRRCRVRADRSPVHRD